MRRRTLQRLANLGRGLLLAATLPCAAVAALWALRPDLVGRAEAWLVERLDAPWLRRWNEALAAEAVDPAAAYQHLRALSGDLAPVRKLDRGLGLARLVEQRASQLAEGLGDRPAALHHARRLAGLDDRDLLALRRLGELLGADPATRREAIELLAPACQRFPDSPDLAPLLAGLLLADGSAAAAVEVLAAAAAQPRSNRWSVRWAEGAECCAWLSPARRRDGGLEARFTITGEVRCLELLPPPWSGIEVEGIRLQQPGASAVLAWDAAALAGKGGGPWFRLELPQPLPAGEHTFVLELAVVDREPAWLRQFLFGAPGAALAADKELRGAAARQLLRLRAQALRGEGLELVTTGAGGERRLPARLSGEADGEGLQFTVRWPLVPPVEVLCLRLPGLPASYRLAAIELRDGDGGLLGDLADAQPDEVQDLRWQGGEATVGGPEPRLVLRLRPGLATARRLDLRGVAR